MEIQVKRSDKGKITREVQQNKISRIKIERYLEEWSYFGSILGASLGQCWILTGGSFGGFISFPVVYIYYIHMYIYNS